MTLTGSFFLDSSWLKRGFRQSQTLRERGWKVAGLSMRWPCCRQFLREEQVRTTIKAIVLIILITGTFVHAQEAVPREDFIATTSKIIHALDEVEAACDDPESGKQAVDNALKKLRNASDEYKRYDVDVQTLDNDQKEIVKTLAAAERSYKLFSFSLGPCCAAPTEDEIIQATKYLENARSLFLHYKEKK